MNAKKKNMKAELTAVFKSAGLTKEQISYAHTIKQMFSSWPVEKVIAEAKNYVPMTVVLIK